MSNQVYDPIFDNFKTCCILGICCFAIGILIGFALQQKKTGTDVDQFNLELSGFYEIENKVSLKYSLFSEKNNQALIFDNGKLIGVELFSSEIKPDYYSNKFSFENKLTIPLVDNLQTNSIVQMLSKKNSKIILFKEGEAKVILSDLVDKSLIEQRDDHYRKLGYFISSYRGRNDFR